MKNPYLNALSAAAYIAVVGTFLHYVEQGHANTPDKWWSGIAFISLVTLSVAMMGYFFAFKPLQMYLDGERRAAVQFFVKTLGTFAVFTITLLLIVFLN
ncbi:hypothetical protein KW796_01865 [Candidatus Parcubacteria bacterium]|nr:hypothetical protein [Candidatus Parcubacteria bacterium]